MTRSVPPSKHQVPQRVIDSIWDRIDIRHGNECWPWKLSRGSHGYGQMGWGISGGRNAGTTTHRIAWIATWGPIPAGMVIDHRCRNRPCCNPLHLRLLTNVENAADNGRPRTRGGHTRWHINKRVIKPGCKYCETLSSRT
jgi:hypothetical protein